MRLTRCILAAATVAASATAFGIPIFFMDSMSPGPDATQVRMVSDHCHGYGGPYCGWVRRYRGGCDKDWGLSFGFKNPNRLCRNDPRPSASAK